jgi:hypothetical protein
MSTIPVWQTLSEAFELVHQRLALFLEALWIPALILVLLQVLFLVGVRDPQSSVHFIFDIASVLIFAWMMNVSCRIAITDEPGNRAWTRRETWTAIWLIVLGFVISVCSALPSGLIFGALYFINPLLAFIAAGITFMLLHLYLSARFVLVFPATAMGDKASFREAWELTAGNGWRVLVLMVLVPFMYCLIAMILAILLPERLFIALLSIVGVFFALVGVVAVSLAYKKLKF